MQNDVRPKRLAIPVGTKRDVCARQDGVCKCGCGMPVSERPKTGTKFDHRPPLRLRDVNAAGTDYIPPQHSADHIDAICREEHDRRTFKGVGAQRSDAVNIARERRREKPPKPKRQVSNRMPNGPRWKSGGMGKRPPGAGNGFPPRGSTPMRRKT